MFQRRPLKQRPRTSVQNEAKDWQFWLRAGSLCIARNNLFLSGREQDGFLQTFIDRWRSSAGAVLLKGQHCICLGEISRRKVEDFSSNSRAVKTVVANWLFLFPTGTFIADPNFFVEGDSLDEV